MNWRLIPSSCKPTPGHMAYDLELFKGFQSGHPPILRFFFFDRPTLTLGRQEARRLNLSNLAYPYEIRPTGGRMVLHGEADLCYSITASSDDPRVGGDRLGSYLKISGLLTYALRGLGREVKLSGENPGGLKTGHCFSASSFAELTLKGKKVAGGAQAREGNIFHQQGVILLSVSPGWKSLFPGEEGGSMVGLNDDHSQAPLSRAELEKAIVAIFEEVGITFEKHFVPV
jgi:lipoyl(octanoyl) transferase